MSVALAADLGGTRIKVGAVDQNGRILASEQFEAKPGGPFRVQLETVAQEIERLAARADTAIKAVRGLVLGFPGIVDGPERQILSTPAGKYEDAVGFDIAAWTRSELGLDLVLENDARMALIGEWQHGAGRGISDLVTVTLGTGLGTGVVSGGKVIRGAHGRAGILGGHVSVRYGGARCPCGNRGCAEAEASSGALARVVAEIPDCASSRLLETGIDYGDVVGLADTGDRCAELVIEHSLRVWTTFIVNLLHAYDPGRVVVGGGIAQHHPNLVVALRRSVEEAIARVSWTPAAPLELVPSALWGDAALLAAHPLLDEAGVRDD